MGELGLLGLRYPEQYGGQGGDYFSAIVLAEEMARCGSGGVGMAISVQTGDGDARPSSNGVPRSRSSATSSPAIRGEKIAALGITEPDAGSDVANIRTRAERVDGHWRINGSKLYITNGVRCDFILLVARTGAQEDGAHGITLFLVDKNLPGFTVSRKLKKLGMHSSDTAELSFNDVEVGDDAVLGEVGPGLLQPHVGAAGRAHDRFGRRHRRCRGRLRGDARSGARSVRRSDGRSASSR